MLASVAARCSPRLGPIRGRVRGPKVVIKAGGRTFAERCPLLSAPQSPTYLAPGATRIEIQPGRAAADPLRATVLRTSGLAAEHGGGGTASAPQSDVFRASRRL